MPSPPIDFKKIREHDGSRPKGFEELCCQLAALESRPTDAEHFRKGPGADAGVECFTRFADGSETGWQAKYYWEIGSSLKGDLDASIRSALAKHPTLSTYIVCIPFDLSDARTGTKTKSALANWEEWKQKWIAKAAADSRHLDIQLWSAHELRERLTRDDKLYRGRLLYWFGTQHLTTDWFRGQFDRTKADLGNRYTAKTNVALDIRRAFLGLARGPELGREIERWWLAIGRASTNALRDMRKFADHAATGAPGGLDQALRDLDAALSTPDLDLAKNWPLDAWGTAVDNALEATRAAETWCFRDDTDGTEEGKKAHDYLQHELRKLSNTLEDIRADLGDALWSHANDRAVLVHGAGGIGKSHLLGDVTAYQLEKSRPALLLLGQHFTDGDPWPQIVDHLDLPAGTTTDAFLGALDAAGQAAGVRTLLLIDALNEKHGPSLWRDRLAGFFHKAEQFSHIAVVLSCRTTYLSVVIPENLTEDRLPRLEHRGFSHDDARAYLKARHFVLPGTPLPAPEFAVPLFLKTCCDALEKQGSREFPRGIRGTTALFDFYTSAVTAAVNTRVGLDERRRIVPRAIDAISGLMIDAGDEWVPVDKVLDCFEGLLPGQWDRDRNLLTQLENEGMLTVEAGTGSDDAARDGTGESVRFTFQRFSDHALASHLLGKHLDPNAPTRAFAEGGPLHDLVIGDRAWQLSGVLEAFAVQLPERCDAELPDMVPDAPTRRWLVREAFRESLLWRNQETFKRHTLDLVEDLLGADEVLPTLLCIATEPDNAFNVEHLHKRLLSCSMPERDAHWSIEIAQIAEDPDGPVETLIDWTWTNGTGPIEQRRAELAGMTLTWLLTTSHRAVRDRATKALVSLMTPRPALPRTLLKRFWDVDDDYLKERLLAAMYGALLQGQWNNDDIGKAAANVYALLFDPGPPPVNALLRDHGRGIIEYALWRKCLPVGVDPSAARPPYSSPWPLECVPDEAIETYKLRTGRLSGFADAIVSSCVTDGDFARYVIDTHVGHWSPAPLGTQKLPTAEDLYRAWRDDFEAWATPDARIALDELEKRAQETKGQGIGEKTPEKAAVEDAKKQFRAKLTTEQWEDWRSQSRDWLAHGMFNDYSGRGPVCFDLAWARRWVCWRAHDLGWSEDIHQEFDRGPLIAWDRMSHRVERIGKKYQWLALYELGARLADNCAFIGNRYGDRSPELYNGESFGSLRDIDPSLLLSSTYDDGWTKFEELCWWAPTHPNLRRISAEEKINWLHGEEDWIDGDQCIDVVGPDGKSWLVLNSFVSSRERSKDSLEEHERDTWSRLSCIVVEKTAKNTVLNEMQKRILTDPWALPKFQMYAGHVYLGEYPWHPAWISVAAEADRGSFVDGISKPVRPTVTTYLCERGTYDSSIAQSVQFTLPAPWLIHAMELHLSDGRQATFDGSNGITRFFDPSVATSGPQAGLVERDAFLAALDREGLAPVWVIAGEKGVYGGMGSQFGGRRDFTSVYWLENGNWRHRRREETVPPARNQIEALLGGPAPNWIQLRNE